MTQFRMDLLPRQGMVDAVTTAYRSIRRSEENGSLRIAVIGAGYVGLVSAACFAALGAKVTSIDIDASRIGALQQGKLPLFEPGLEPLVHRQVAEERLAFTSDLAAVGSASIVFIAVGTPPCPRTGKADLSYLIAAAEGIAAAARNPLLVVTKSTVPVGTSHRLASLFRERRPELRIDVASNPEFLREGSAIADFMQAGRIVYGYQAKPERDRLAQLYRPLSEAGVPLLITDATTAEMIKYASNAFLAAKISFINEMADLCETVGANVQDVARGMGMDARIGASFLQPGPGYGGSCFPKDVQALIAMARDHQVTLGLVEATAQANERRRTRMLQRIMDACDGSVMDKRVAVLGVTFKAGTDDVRDSPALMILPALAVAGATITAYDPKGMQQAKAFLPDVEWCPSAAAAIKGADALVILTDWDEFYHIRLDKARRSMRAATMVDLRNMFDPATANAAGFDYHSIGRPSLVHTQSLLAGYRRPDTADRGCSEQIFRQEDPSLSPVS
jgi:UDPglucose 6-dehydrogenase